MGPLPAVEQYLEDQREFARGVGAGPAWIGAIREAAIRRFAELGFPTSRQEEWRFTSVQPIVQRRFAAAAPPAAVPGLDDLSHLLIDGARYRLVFLNGRFSAGLSSLKGLPAGARCGSLVSEVAADGDLVARHLAQYATIDRNPFTALSTAFLADGAFVYLPPRTVLDEPLQLLFVTIPERGPGVSHPRALVVLDRDAEANVVETHAGLGDGPYFTNAVSEIALGDGARCGYCRVQREGEQAAHVAATRSHQGRDTRLASTTVALGGALSRHEVGAVLAGSGGSLVLDGLSVLAGRQHVDHHTILDHAEPHCESHELFNGIYDGRSRGVFTGRIIVRPGAQRTDSKQTNNNLLLSEEARADSQPQLEIYADDVKCTHGATLGPLDQNALFYMRSRGMGAAEARAALTYGFGAEILDRLAVPELRTMLDRAVRARLAEPRLRAA